MTTTQSGWQAQIARFQNQSFVNDPAEATAAVRRFVPEAGEVETDDAEFGLYLIDLTDDQVAELEEDGFLQFTDSEYQISVEMP